MANTDPGHWFWRGVQSAIFYYVSCSPFLEYKYKKKRRKEAQTSREEVITTQPGALRQPHAFQTNEQWAEELMLGPGPPKPWKPDELLQKVKQKLAPTPVEVAPRPSLERGRPSMDRRISGAIVTVKDTIKQSLYPDKWNWKRYDREDEFGLGDKVTRIWDRVTTMHNEEPIGRRRAHTNDSDRDYTRGRMPAINDLHPPVVSQLPATKDEAAWMLLPPPSAAVMNGKSRPGEEMMQRTPLAVIGRPLPPEPPARKEEEWETDAETPFDDRPGHGRHVSEPMSQRRPNLRPLGNERHFSEPIQLLGPPPAVTPDLFNSSPDIIDTRSEILPLGGPTTPKPRPSSWQFFLIPTQ